MEHGSSDWVVEEETKMLKTKPITESRWNLAVTVDWEAEK
jgi:hypothetical protein